VVRADVDVGDEEVHQGEAAAPEALPDGICHLPSSVTAMKAQSRVR
jgi:hypothetical protein